MYAALCSLEHSSELVHAICRGEEPSNGIYYWDQYSIFLKLLAFSVRAILNHRNALFFQSRLESYGELPTSLFLTQFGFKKLNTYQEAAVKEALCHPFTLIQGPPGKNIVFFDERLKAIRGLRIISHITTFQFD